VEAMTPVEETPAVMRCTTPGCPAEVVANAPLDGGTVPPDRYVQWEEHTHPPPYRMRPVAEFIEEDP
jgi:hypothetical protein